MSFRVRFTLEAKSDLERLYGFLAEHDVTAAARALEMMDRAWSMLEDFPFACRRAEEADPFLRELLSPFGDSGCVALFEVDDAQTVTVLAVRHQQEDDYH